MLDRAYKKLSMDELVDRIIPDTDTLILFHRHPDADAIGSTLALRLLLKAQGCRVSIACEDEIPERLQFLHDGKQEFAQYTRLPSDYSPIQIIAVDTASPSQLGALYQIFGDRVDLMIDHHERGEMYADGWICGKAAATGEMILDIAEALLEKGRISEIPTGVYPLLYAAISSDTGCFRYSNVTPDTHMRAARIVSHGIDTASINHLLFESKSYKVLSAEKAGFDRLRLYSGGRVAIIPFPYELKVELGLSDEHLETLVDVARSLEGVMVAVTIRQPSSDGVFRASMRSSCDLDVAKICAEFGGGGHIRAAGCTITADSIDEAVEIVAKRICECF